MDNSAAGRKTCFGSLLILQQVVRVPILTKGPFKYYVIMFLTFLVPPTHLFDDVILEWSLSEFSKLSKDYIAEMPVTLGLVIFNLVISLVP